MDSEMSALSFVAPLLTIGSQVSFAECSSRASSSKCSIPEVRKEQCKIAFLLPSSIIGSKLSFQVRSSWRARTRNATFINGVFCTIADGGTTSPDQIELELQRIKSKSRFSTCTALDTVINADAASFEAKVLAEKMPVLVEFYREECIPCRMIAPLLDWLATNCSGKLKIVKINGELNAQLASAYDVQSFPTLLIVHCGTVVGRRAGVLPKAALREFAEGVISATAAAAASLMDSAHVPEAASATAASAVSPSPQRRYLLAEEVGVTQAELDCLL